MQIMLISYHLCGAERSGDNERLITAIRRYPSCEVMSSQWLIRSDRPPERVLNELWTQMDASDRLLVTDVTGNVMAWLGLNRDVARWILVNNPAGG